MKITLREKVYLMMSSTKFSSRAAQRMVSAGNGTKTSRTHANGADRGGFCGAIQRSPPVLPPSLARRLSNKETMGFGRVSWDEQRRWWKIWILISESATAAAAEWMIVWHSSVKRKEKFLEKIMNFSWHISHTGDCRYAGKNPSLWWKIMEIFS